MAGRASFRTLQDVYYAENQIVKSLPDMIEKATNRKLTAALRGHLKETQGHVKRLEQVFKKLGEEPQGHRLPRDGRHPQGSEGNRRRCRGQQVLDAAIIGASQAVEHYEIIRYGTLIAWAKTLGHRDAIRLFNANLKEAKAADKKLTGLAENGVNRKAKNGRGSNGP